MSGQTHDTMWLLSPVAAQVKTLILASDPIGPAHPCSSSRPERSSGHQAWLYSSPHTQTHTRGHLGTLLIHCCPVGARANPAWIQGLPVGSPPNIPRFTFSCSSFKMYFPDQEASSFSGTCSWISSPLGLRPCLPLCLTCPSQPHNPCIYLHKCKPSLLQLPGPSSRVFPDTSSSSALSSPPSALTSRVPSLPSGP